MTTLRDCCIEVMNDREVVSRYPNGLDGNDILAEIRVKHGPDAFPYVSILDVCDEMTAVYGRGRQP